MNRLAAQHQDSAVGTEHSMLLQNLLPAADLERWADQGLDMVVPPIDSGPVAFTHLHDACPT